MKLYSGIDLHSTNSYVAIVDEEQWGRVSTLYKC